MKGKNNKSISRKTRKNTSSSRSSNSSKNNNAKKATQIKCLMKTCRAKKYMSVYGSTGGTIRSNTALFN